MRTMSDKPKSQTQDKFIARLPDGMRDRIAVAAEVAGRSMNAEIVHRLQRSFDEQGPSGLKRELAITELSEHAKVVAKYWAMEKRTPAQNELLAEAMRDLAMWQRQVAKLSA